MLDSLCRKSEPEKEVGTQKNGSDKYIEKDGMCIGNHQTVVYWHVRLAWILTLIVASLLRCVCTCSHVLHEHEFRKMLKYPHLCIKNESL